MRRESLCWDCAYAYAHLCFSVPLEKRHWVGRKVFSTHKLSVADKNNNDDKKRKTCYTVWRIYSCARFRPDAAEAAMRREIDG